MKFTLRPPKITFSSLKVLQLFCDNPHLELAGIDISRATGVPSGVVYPMLGRLEIRGWFTSRWEDIKPRKAGRPKCHLYRITPEGITEAEAVFRDFCITARIYTGVLRQNHGQLSSHVGETKAERLAAFEEKLKEEKLEARSVQKRILVPRQTTVRPWHQK